MGINRVRPGSLAVCFGSCEQNVSELVRTGLVAGGLPIAAGSVIACAIARLLKCKGREKEKGIAIGASETAGRLSDKKN